MVSNNLRFTFIEASQNIWSPSEKDGHVSKPQGFIGGLLHGNSTKAKLKGKYHWPFSLTLPTTTDLPEEKGGAVKSYRLPQSLAVPSFPAYIVYKVVAHIQHGTLLQPDETYVQGCLRIVLSITEFSLLACSPM